METIEDIIAEMLGARTEFPFVYLMGEPDTPEVIDLKTKKIIEPRKINIRRVTVKELAERLKAARKRERGNSAALREALKAAELGLFRWLSGSISRDEHRELVATIKTALAAPPRNCDRFGGDNAKLQKVYYSECGKEYEPQDPNSRQAYLVGYGNWLLAPATEKEGGAK